MRLRLNIMCHQTHPTFYYSVDIFTHFSEMIMNFRIRYPQNFKIVAGEKLGALQIVFFTFLSIVSGTVKLDNEPCSRRIKINYVFSQHLLPCKTYRIPSQKIVPKMIFFIRHSFSQHFCRRDHSLVVFSLHRIDSRFDKKLSALYQYSHSSIASANAFLISASTSESAEMVRHFASSAPTWSRAAEEPLNAGEV